MIVGQQPTTRLTPDDIKDLVASLQDITATLAGADPTDKAVVYAEMGTDITNHQDGRVVVASRPHPVASPSSGTAGTQTDSPKAGPRCRRSVPIVDYTDSGVGDVVRCRVRCGDDSQLRRSLLHVAQGNTGIKRSRDERVPKRSPVAPTRPQVGWSAQRCYGEESDRWPTGWT